MKRIAFVKGHGTGNDFIVIPDEANELELSPHYIRRICDRHFGIGADGVLHALKQDGTWFMDYRNADGSIAEMCGNGIRVFAEYLFRENLIESNAEIITRAGVKDVSRVSENLWAVQMGAPHISESSTEVEYCGSQFNARAINVGNPHRVVVLSSLADLPVELRWDDAPPVQGEGFNLEFYEIIAPGSLRMRVLERGVGETLSCGTGVCAVAFDYFTTTGLTSCEVRVPGGVLQVERKVDEIVLIGPVELIADGFVELT